MDEAKKEAPQVPTIVSVFKTLATEGVKDRKEATTKIMAHFQKLKVTKNTKGKPITEERVSSLVNAILRDIKAERKGWWDTYSIVEDDKQLKIVLRA